MNRSQRINPAAGFTLIELLIVLALLGIMLAIGLPNLLAMIQRSKILGVTRETVSLMRLARLEAIKTSENTGVTVQTVDQVSTVVAFTDADHNNTLDATDRLLGRVDLPRGVSLLAVDGFTTPPTPAVAVFRPSGSVAVVGAFQFSNPNGDQLEARVTTQSGARIQIRKYDGSGNWYAQGEGGRSWTWK
jgi:prepilin-type N-terminal cleavage/methylation domain-containing protein